MNDNHTGALGSAPLFHLADRALNRPLVIHPDKATIILDVLAGRIGVQSPGLGGLTPEASRFFGSPIRGDGGGSMNRNAGGVAIISVVGSLVNRGAWIGASSGLVSYEGISAQIEEAAADPTVHSILLDIDSGGGEAGGITSISRKIREIAKTKRVVAVVNDVAASGGYWLASAANEVVVSETSTVGSIGVVVIHVNRSGELQQAGLAPTLIFSGAHKVDGNSLGPLPDSVRADTQAMIDTLYGQFAEGVAMGRGARLSAEAARATEARVYQGQAAIDVGLADRLGTFESVLAELQTRRTALAGRQSQKGKIMTEQVQTEGGISADAHAAGVAAARTEGATAERTRIKTIMSCEAAAERPALARQVALETDMSAEAAAAFMASLPTEKPGAGVPPLAQRHADAGAGFGNDLAGDAQRNNGAGAEAAGQLMSMAVQNINKRRAK